MWGTSLLMQMPALESVSSSSAAEEESQSLKGLSSSATKPLGMMLHVPECFRSCRARLERSLLYQMS